MGETPPPARSDADEVRPPNPAQRWSAWKGALLGGICPATASQRTQHVGLGAAYGIHLFFAFTAAALIVGFIAVAGVSGPLTLGRVLSEWGNLFEEMFKELDRRPLEAMRYTLATVALVELVYLLLGLIVTPWGARDEKRTSSTRHALRWTWLHSGQVVVAVLLVGLLSMFYGRAERQHFNRNWTAGGPVYPTAPPTQPTGSPAWKAYQKEVEAYNKKWNEFYAEVRASRPWFVRNGPYLIIATVLSGLSWLLWGILRGVGAHRANEAVDRPPTCETCGYNLTAAPMEGRCPECGEWVIRSLGPDVRPGCVWEHRDRVGWLFAWWQTNVDALVSPTRLGRRIRVTEGATDHRRFAAMHLPIVFAIGYVAVLAIYFASTGGSPFDLEQEVGWGVAPVLGFIVAIVGLGLPLLAAEVVAAFYWRQDRRNLMSASMQIACYLSSFATLWAAVSGSLGVLILFMEVPFRHLGRALDMDGDTLAFTAWAVPNAAALAFYFIQVYRGTAAARYANR